MTIVIGWQWAILIATLLVAVLGIWYHATDPNAHQPECAGSNNAGLSGLMCLVGVCVYGYYQFRDRLSELRRPMKVTGVT